MAYTPNEVLTDSEALRESVREAYSNAAADPDAKHSFPVGAAFARSVGYSQEWLDRLPSEASAAFAGVSNVCVRAPILEGMLILDLGCGAGLDSIIAAERAGRTSRVIGVDFSAAMLERARCASVDAGVHNVNLVRAPAESLPLKDACVDLILINGILNLNPRRSEILRELARVLKPGGQVFGAELILDAPLPESLRAGAANWFS